MFAHSLAMFYIAYVLLAVGFGATNCCHPVAVQETYGSKYAGGIFGICMLGYMIICTFISPKISSALVNATGSYTASMIYAIIACILAVIFYTTIPQPKRRTLAEVAAEEKKPRRRRPRRPDPHTIIRTPSSPHICGMAGFPFLRSCRTVSGETDINTKGSILWA